MNEFKQKRIVFAVLSAYLERYFRISDGFRCQHGFSGTRHPVNDDKVSGVEALQFLLDLVELKETS